MRTPLPALRRLGGLARCRYHAQTVFPEEGMGKFVIAPHMRLLSRRGPRDTRDALTCARRDHGTRGTP
jgi:hypothetical protein